MHPVRPEDRNSPCGQPHLRRMLLSGGNSTIPLLASQMHSDSFTAPSTGVTMWCWHDWQPVSLDVLPSSGPKVSTGHACGWALPTRQYDPRGHALHESSSVAPVALLKVPALHAIGVIVPSSQKCPRGQSSGMVVAGAAQL